MRKLFVWGTIASGAVALYLMMKRGETFSEAATNAVQHPFGSLVNELKRS